MALQPPSPSLFTDLYELTMAQAYWQSGQTASSTFSLYFRDYPPDRGYFVTAGLADVLDYLENLRFSSEDIDGLGSLGRFDGGFLEHLRSLRFSGSVRAMPEGTIFFANEPVLEVTAPVLEAQLVETFLLNQVYVQATLATKAARVVHAARGKSVIDFAARRCQGLDAADKFARVSYMAGFDGTSNTLAGLRYAIPVSGTMAHSFITSFSSEIEAFRHFARSFPEGSTFLVDTYDTLEGTKRAVVVANEMKKQGRRLRAIRLDSGDLLDLSRKCRAILNDAGLPDVEIFASGGLDEFEIDALLQAGAPIDGFGVGGKVGVAADAPVADCVYKQVAYGGEAVLKLSTKKATLPGPKQVIRHRADNSDFRYDVLACAGEKSEGQSLLSQAMQDGRRIVPNPGLEELRRRFREEFTHLPTRHKALHRPEHFEVRISENLERLRQQVVRDTEKRLAT